MLIRIYVLYATIEARMFCVFGKMKKLIIFCFFLFAVCQETPYSELLFRIFMKKYNKPYETGSDEYKIRLKNFQGSLKRQKHSNSNRTGESALYDINELSDLSQSEFENVYLRGRFGITTESSNDTILSTKIPKSFDWAFSLVESIESSNFIENGHLTDLSVQQLIDCAPLPVEDKCKGGDIGDAANWLLSHQINITTEHKYPLSDTSNTCNIHPTNGIRIDYAERKEYINNEQEMMEYIATRGPLTVAVDAALWQDYLGGIIRWRCYTNLNHAVQIVGYNTQGSVPYFIVRNSWGTGWGLNGYAYIEMNKNMCGIASEVVKVKVEKDKR